MPRFSANLGLLWADLPLPDAIRAAAWAGFDAVELQWLYDFEAAQVRAALDETGLPLLSLNTEKGPQDLGAFGTCAIAELGRNSAQKAMTCARAVGAPAIHALPGITSGKVAWQTFEDTLRFACDAASDLTILIEPINRYDVPGYLLHNLDDAVALIETIGHPRLKLMFDFYHIGRTHDDPIARFHDALPYIGHIQVASVPDRGAPDHGALNFEDVFAAIDSAGWSKPIGAEYRPIGPTEASLGWLKKYKT